MKGLGTDIIEISRIRASIARHGQHFLDKVFTQHEQDYCLKHRDAGPHFAARFAAKEAVVKAFGTGFRDGISWLDIEIQNTPQGQPQAVLSPRLNEMLGSPQLLLSMSHCREYAIATAIWLST